MLTRDETFTCKWTDKLRSSWTVHQDPVVAKIFFFLEIQSTPQPPLKNIRGSELQTVCYQCYLRSCPAELLPYHDVPITALREGRGHGWMRGEGTCCGRRGDGDGAADGRDWAYGAGQDRDGWWSGDERIEGRLWWIGIWCVIGWCCMIGSG